MSVRGPCQPLQHGDPGGGAWPGVALGHSVLSQPEIEAGRLVCPFEQVLESKNAYYLVCQESQAEQGKIAAFRDWMLALVEQEEAQRMHLPTGDAHCCHTMIQA